MWMFLWRFSSLRLLKTFPHVSHLGSAISPQSCDFVVEGTGESSRLKPSIAAIASSIAVSHFSGGMA